MKKRVYLFDITIRSLDGVQWRVKLIVYDLNLLNKEKKIGVIGMVDHLLKKNEYNLEIFQCPVNES